MIILQFLRVLKTKKKELNWVEIWKYSRCSSSFDIKKKPEHTLVGSGNSLLITSKQLTSSTWARTLTTAWSSSLKLQTGMAYRMLYNTPDKQKRSSLYLDQMKTCFTGWIWKKKKRCASYECNTIQHPEQINILLKLKCFQSSQLQVHYAQTFCFL